MLREASQTQYIIIPIRLFEIVVSSLATLPTTQVV
jgi:hypothetical protein